MVNISKRTKIILLINSIAAFIFMVFYLVIPELYFELVDGLVFDPYYWRAFGATLLVLGLFSLRSALSGKEEYAKLILEIAIVWPGIILTLNIWELFVLPLSPTYTINTWFNSAILLGLIILNAFAYFKERE